MNTGDNGFVLICAALVFIMTPGLAFFYGGLVRRKNIVNTMMACAGIMGLSVVLWVVCGFSLSFGADHGGVIGGFEYIFLNGISFDEALSYAPSLSSITYVVFQMMFAMITPALITGSVAGRMRYKALFLFIALWSLVVYYPMAHMVWGSGGFLAELGAVDFAGGNVVHISSGVSGLILAIILGRRAGVEHTSYRVHNIPFVFLGSAVVRMVRFQRGFCAWSKRPCGTCIFDLSAFFGGRSARMDALRYHQGRQADTGGRLDRSCCRPGRHNARRWFCAGVVGHHNRRGRKPYLLFHNEFPKEKA